MPAATDNAIFTEQLELQVQTQQFIDGMSAIEQAYADSLKRMNDMGGPTGVVDGSAIGAVSEQIKGLADSLNSFTTGMAEQLGALTGTVVDTLTQLVESVGGSVKAAETEATQASIGIVQTSADKVQAVLSQINDAQKNQSSIARLSYQEQLDVFNQVQTQIEERGISVLENLSSANRKWFDNYARGIAESENAVKAQAARVNEEVASNRVAAEAKATKAVVEERQSAIRQEAEQENKLYDQRLSQAKKINEEQIALLESWVTKQKVADQEVFQNRQRLFERGKEAQVAAGSPGGVSGAFAAGIGEAPGALQKVQGILSDGIEGTVGAIGAGIKGILGDLGSMAVGLGEIFLVWQAIQLVISIIKLPVTAMESFAGFLKLGMDYTTQLQKDSAELQAVLAGNVKFADDFATNYAKAGIAAREVQKAIQDAGAATGIQVKVLDTAFSAFVESGGHALTSSLREDVQVVSSLTQAFYATNKPSIALNRLTQELPKLLDGTLPAGSRLEAALHLSKDQMAAIVAHAREHHDLLTQLEPALRPFLSVQADAQLRVASLNEQLALTKDRIAAFIAEPLWNAYLAILQKIKQFYEDHQGQIEAIAGLLQSFLREVIGLFGDLARVGTDSLTPFSNIFKALVHDALAFANSITNVISGLDALAKVNDAFVKFTSGPAQGDKTKLVDSVKDAYQDFQLAVQTRDDLLKDFDEGRGAKKGGLLDGLFGPEPNTNDSKGKPDNTALDALKAEYKLQLKEIIDAHQEARQKINDSVKTGVTDLKTGTDAIISNFKRESAEVDALGMKYAELAATKGGKASPKAQAAFQNQITGADNAAAKAEATGVEKATTDEVVKIETEGQKRILADREATQRAEVNLAKLTVQSHQQQVGQEIAIEFARHDARMRELDDELVKFRGNAAAINSITTQLATENNRNISTQKDLSAQLKLAEIHDSLEKYKADDDARYDSFNKLKNELKQKEVASKASNKVIKEDNATISKAYADLLTAEANQLKAIKNIAESYSALGQLAPAELDKIKKKWEEINQAAQDAQQKAADAKTQADGASDINSAGTVSTDNLDKLKKTFDGFGKDFGDSVQQLAQGFQFFKGIVSNIIGAFKSGGVTGGIGAIMGTAASFDPEPISRGILSIGSTVMGILSGIFEAQAKKIADDIKKGIKQINDQLAIGAIDLKTAIARLEQERQDAINRLSGVKGGQKQLDEILPGLDQQIAQLQKQAADTVKAFNDNLAVLNLNSQALGNVLKTWQDINKQVKDYLGAGGSVAKANQFLSDSLRDLRNQAVNDLGSAESQAIQDATQLNALLTQRVDLINQEKRAEFSLINGDAIERRQATAITIGQELQQKRADFNTQLQQLNSQIDLTTQRLSLERQVFQIASDTASLQARSNQLNILALTQQIQQWKDLQKVVAGIFQNSSGGFQMTSGFAMSIGAVNINVGTNGIASPATTGQQIATSFLDEIKRHRRTGSRGWN